MDRTQNTDQERGGVGVSTERDFAMDHANIILEESMDLAVSQGIPESLKGTEAHFLATGITEKLCEIGEPEQKAAAVTWVLNLFIGSQARQAVAYGTRPANPTPPGSFTG